MLSASLVRAADAVKLKMTSTDGKLGPLTLEAAAGKTLEIMVVSAGKTLMEFESKPLAFEQNIAAGKTKVIQVKALAAGEYTLVDELNEEKASAQGVLVVK